MLSIYRQTLRNETQAPRQELEALDRNKAQLRKKMRRTLKSNNRMHDQLQRAKASEEDLLAEKVTPDHRLSREE